VDLLGTARMSAQPFTKRVWQLSQDSQGTFVVQRALDECGTTEERVVLAAELRGHVYEATQCPHANHVLRKVIELLPAESLHFVVVELLSLGPNGIVDVASHRFGCRILEGLLLHCPQEQLHIIVDCILAHAPALCTHMYGNFVVQRLLEYSCPKVRSRLLRLIQGSVTRLGTSFYGAAVLGKALQNGSPAEISVLARAIVSVSGLLAAIARYRSGKVVVEIVLEAFDDTEEKQTAAYELAAPPLKASKNGRACC